MKHKSLIDKAGYLLFLMLMSIVVTRPVLAVCIQSDPPADPVLAIDANNGCSDIQGQEGCNIKNVDGGTCTYPASPGPGEDFFTVLSTLNPDGSLSWTLTDDSTIKGVDTAMIGGGAKGKNNCGYSFKYDVDHGSGGDCKVAFDANGDCPGAFQNITSLDICTDGDPEAEPEPPVEPPVATTLKYCQEIAEDGTTVGTEPGQLDVTGIICPVYTVDDPYSVEDPRYGQQKPVIVCNLEKDKYAWGAIGANEDGSSEEVCCKCGLDIANETSCFISDDETENSENCSTTLTSDPTQEVILQFQKDGTDPCEKIRSGGKVYKTCW